MISLLLSLATQTEVYEVLIYVIMALELLGALVNLLIKLIPETNKFGKFLRKLLPGVKSLIDEVKDIKDDETHPG